MSILYDLHSFNLKYNKPSKYFKTMKTTSSENWNLVSSTDSSKRFLLDFEGAKVQFLEFEDGAEIPEHSHNKEALHIVLEGELNLEDGTVITAMSDYRCGGWEYRGQVRGKTRVVVIEPF